MKKLLSSLRYLSAVLAILGAAPPARANNIAVSGMTLTGVNTATHTLMVQLNVSWENSWFLSPSTPPGNYDAAWLVVKYHIGDNIWRTATLDPNPASHTIPANFTIMVGTNTTRAVGVFLHRSVVGNGTATATGVQLKWNYGADGIADSALITAEVHALEMVYVPQGSFTVGDGTSASFFRSGTNNNPSVPFTIINAGLIIAGTNTGSLRVGANNINPTYTIPGTFPNGFNSFYIMKYEASQDQFVDFQNKILGVGQSSTSYNIDRQPITGENPDWVTTSPNRSAISSSEILQYLDFVCLRPMTEFEYEKACRGTNAPVAGEYAWGTAIAATLAYSLTNDGTATEAVATNYNDNAGNCWYLETQRVSFGGPTNFGPCRVGMFAKAAYNGSTSPRIQSGAGFYGAMDLTGNGQERVVAAPVSSSDTTALNFTGENGDGLITTIPNGWPGSGSLVFRGGGYRYKDPVTKTEQAASGAITPVSVQGSNQGGSGAIRGVRSAP